jgi:hypothetical protein
MPHFQQKKGYGCGVYALANTFNDASFITPQRLSQSKGGNHTGQLSKWLIEQNKELYLEPFYFNSMGDKLPEWVCKMVPTEKWILSIPVLIDVQHSESSRTHFVAAEITNTGDLIVRDSLKIEPYITTLEQFNKDNYRVFGIWGLCHYEQKGWVMWHVNNENR